MNKTILITSFLISFNTFACDSFSYYDDENTKISFALSGEPSACKSEEVLKELIKNTLLECKTISKIEYKYDLTEKEAIIACDNFIKDNKKKKSNWFFKLFE